MTSRGRTARARGCRGMTPLAPALLMCVGMTSTACVNPLFFDSVQPAVNHSPLLENMQPPPGFARRVINVGANCGPGPEGSFFASGLNDADLDVLTVRYSLLLPRDGSPDGAREILFEEELEPNPEAQALLVYDFKAFEVDRTKIVNALGTAGLGEQVDPAIEGQLLELRISDRGFKAGGNEPTNDDATLLFLSWSIKLQDVRCES